VPPRHILEVRTLGRLYVALMDERRAWQQRIHAQLFHQGVASQRALLTPAGQFALAGAELSPAGVQMVETAMAAIDTLTEQIVPLRAQLQTIGANQPGVLALTQQYGIGLLSGTIIWAELGDCRRFSHSDQAVRFAGLDVTVWASDAKRSAGRLARQGSPELRWALFEAAKVAARETSPDYAYYDAVRDRLGGKRAALSVARKLVRRCYHTLRELGNQAWLAPAEPEQKAA
jgi:transposase